MHVGGKGSEEQARQAAHGEEADKSQRVEHGSVVRNGTFIKCRGPIENFHRRGDGDQEAKHGEKEPSVNRLAGDEHVMTPNQEADNRNGKAGKSDETVAEDALPRKASDQFAHHAHPGQNHDVNRGVRIKPKQMLEQDGVAADSGIENADMQEKFEPEQEKRDSDHRRAQDKNDAGSVDGPNE